MGQDPLREVAHGAAGAAEVDVREVAGRELAGAAEAVGDLGGVAPGEVAGEHVALDAVEGERVQLHRLVVGEGGVLQPEVHPERVRVRAAGVDPRPRKGGGGELHGVAGQREVGLGRLEKAEAFGGARRGGGEGVRLGEGEQLRPLAGDVRRARGLERVRHHHRAGGLAAERPGEGVLDGVQRDRRRALGVVHVGAGRAREDEPVPRGAQRGERAQPVVGVRVGVARPALAAQEVERRAGVGAGKPVAQADDCQHAERHVPQRQRRPERDRAGDVRLVPVHARQRPREVPPHGLRRDHGARLVQRQEPVNGRPHGDEGVHLRLGLWRERAVHEQEEVGGPLRQRPPLAQPREAVEKRRGPLGEPPQEVGLVHARLGHGQAAEDDLVHRPAGVAHEQPVQPEAPRVHVVLGEAEGGLVRGVAAPVDAGVADPLQEQAQLAFVDARRSADDRHVQEPQEVAGRGPPGVEGEDPREGVEDAGLWRVRRVGDVVGEAEPRGGLGAEDGVHERGVRREVGHEDADVAGAEAGDRAEGVEDLVAEHLQLAQRGVALVDADGAVHVARGYVGRGRGLGWAVVAEGALEAREAGRGLWRGGAVGARRRVCRWPLPMRRGTLRRHAHLAQEAAPL